MATHHSRNTSLVTPLILAGGQSRRMGMDKRFLEIDGEPLVRRAIRVAAPFGEPLVLVRDGADRDRVAPALPSNTRFHLDTHPGGGPLCALAGALGEIDTQWALLLAADLPRVDTALLAGLIEKATQPADSADRHAVIRPVVVVPESHRLQVTCAVYAAVLGPELMAACAAGQRSLTAWVTGQPSVRTRVVRRSVWRALIQPSTRDPFQNINTEADALAVGAKPRVGAAPDPD